MARRILAFDLGSHLLKAVLIESTLRGCRVVGLFQQQRDPNRVLAEQVRELWTAHDLHGDTVLSCLPGNAVTHRFLSFPFAQPRQLSQVVPYELESLIPFGREEVVIDTQIVKKTTDEVTILAVAVPKPTLTEHLETLVAAGLDPTVVGLAPLAPLSLLNLTGMELQGITALLDIGENRTSVLLLRDGVLSGLRTLTVGLSRTGGFAAFMQELRWTLLVLGGDEPVLPSRFFLCGGGACFAQLRKELAQGLNTEILPFQQLVLPAVPEMYREEQAVFASCLGLGFSEALGVVAPRVNLRREEFAHRGHNDLTRREWVLLGWLATGIAVAAGLAFALEIYRWNTHYQALRQEVRRVFAATLPEVQTVVNEKAQLEEAVAALQNRRRLIHGVAAASPLEVLRQLSVALPEHVSLDLDEWAFDEEGVRLRGTTSSFEAAETIKTAAMGLGLFREVQLKDVKAVAGSKKVAFGLQMLFEQEGQGHSEQKSGVRSQESEVKIHG